MRKKELEIKLQSLKEFEDPSVELEQYSTPAPLAASLLQLAKLEGNIINNKVYDLGCGTGTFAIGAKLLGADKVVGVDIDENALNIAKENCKSLEAEVEFIEEDVSDVDGEGDTVIQNPPFGAQKFGSDRPFIKKSLEIAPIVYSIHRDGTRRFIEEYVRENNGYIEEEITLNFPIRRRFNFHKEEEKSVKVNLFKFIKDQ